MKPAEELRAAAAKLREMADDLGDWRYDDGNTMVRDRNGDIVAAHVTQGDGIWIALMGPDKADVLASWLERAADQLAMHLPYWGSHEGAVDDPPIIRTAEDTAAIVNTHFGPELTFARSIRGESR